MNWLLGQRGIPKDSEAGIRQFGFLMERRRAEESAADYEEIRRDWVLGSEAFRQELLAAMVERIAPSHYCFSVGAVLRAESRRFPFRGAPARRPASLRL